MKWNDGLKRFAEIFKSEKELPLKRPRNSSQCEACGKITGSQVYCKICNKKTIHKKKCAGVILNTWTCKDCKEVLNPKLGSPENDSIQTLEPLLLSRKGSSISDINITQSINNILEDALKDENLYNIIHKGQKEFIEINKEIEKMKSSLEFIQKPEDIRRNKYKIDEYLRTRSESLISEVFDKLHCAHISGFESAKNLRKIFEGDINALDRYKAMQKDVVVGLLKAALPSNKQIDDVPQLSKFEKFMDKNNPKGIYAKLNSTIEKFKAIKIEEKPSGPTLKAFYGIVKTVIDGTLANCEYTSGQQIDLVGGGTNPELLKSLLNKLKEKYQS
jgi:hypothetical protein